MKIHLSHLPTSENLAAYMVNQTRPKKHVSSASFEFPPLPPPPNLLPPLPFPPPPARHSWTVTESDVDDTNIRSSDVVIGLLSPNIYTAEGLTLRSVWNAILVNKRPRFVLVYEHPVSFISHTHISVRRISFEDREQGLRELHDLLNNRELNNSFEAFTYIHSLHPQRIISV